MRGLLIALSLTALWRGPARSARRRRDRSDNSFLVERPTIRNGRGAAHQHLSHPTRGSAWAYGFTQEWPVGSQRHQLATPCR